MQIWLLAHIGPLAVVAVIQVRVFNESTGEVHEALLPDKDFLIVACQWSEAYAEVEQYLADRSSVWRFRRASTLADQAVTALGRIPLLVLKDEPVKAEA